MHQKPAAAGQVDTPVLHNARNLLRWRRKLPRVQLAVLPATTSRPNPLLIGNRLFASIFSPGAVVAVERLTGKPIWRRQIPSFAGSSLLGHGTMIYANSANTLHALDQEDGHVVWQFSPQGTVGETMYSAPSWGHGRLFIGDRAGNLHALEAKSGKRLWSVLTSRARNNDVNGAPLVDGDRVYVATNAGRVLAFDARTGGLVWKQEIGLPSANEIRVVPPGALLIAATSSLFWLNRDTGAIQDRCAFPRRFLLSYACKGERVLAVLTRDSGRTELLGLRDHAVVFRRTCDVGSVRWLSNGSVFESRVDGLGVLNPNTGECVHHIRFPVDNSAAPPEFRAGCLYVLTQRGSLWALNWPPSEGAEAIADRRRDVPLTPVRKRPSR